MKQTAVEWLEEQLKCKLIVYIDEAIQQAKAMEKEQIMEAYDKGDGNGAERIYYHDIRNDISSEQYYNETFKLE